MKALETNVLSHHKNSKLLIKSICHIFLGDSQHLISHILIFMTVISGRTHKNCGAVL